MNIFRKSVHNSLSKVCILAILTIASADEGQSKVRYPTRTYYFPTWRRDFFRDLPYIIGGNLSLDSFLFSCVIAELFT